MIVVGQSLSITYPNTEDNNVQVKFLYVSLLFILIGIPTMMIVFKLINDLEMGLKFEAIKTIQDLKTSNHME